MGLRISEIGPGALTFDGQCHEATSVEILDEATDRGVMSLDLDQAYSSDPARLLMTSSGRATRHGRPF